MTNRAQTINDHRERLNSVLIHIEENLDNPLSLNTLARVACFSPFHFHRIFAAYVGETLNDYVRRLRLEKAALRLSYSGRPVTSIALAAGYETPAAFTRAFKQSFGKSPSQFKATRQSRLTKLLAPTSALKKIKNVKPEIRLLQDQKVIFMRSIGDYDKSAYLAWDRLKKFADARGIAYHDAQAIGICRDNPDITPEAKVRYDACLTIDVNMRPEGEVGVYTLCGGNYAIFLHKGPYAGLGKTYDAVFAQWLPASGKTLRNLPYFEVYLNDYRRSKPANLRTEICVPIE